MNNIFVLLHTICVYICVCVVQRVEWGGIGDWGGTKIVNKADDCLD